MRIKNSFTGEVEELELEDPVSIYYCGLTVSDTPHLGHARGWVHTDVLRRYISYQGFDVKYVENFTDINEKIFTKLGDENVSAESEVDLADSYIDEVLDAIQSLNVQRATAYPRVSDYIDEIIDYVQSLIDSGYAYVSNESVYFDVEEFEDYGQLSNQSLKDMESQDDLAEVKDKRNESDFALWKAVNPEKTRGEAWESPWGTGRPGWHIECSVMSQQNLDTPIDIHVGGHDLVFPHHENEIAQSEADSEERFVDNWMHIGLLESKSDSEKMSSSRDNFRTVQSAVEEFGGNTVRWFLLSSNYSSKQVYSDEKIQVARHKWIEIEKTYNRLEEIAGKSDASVTHAGARGQLEERKKIALSSLSKDLNTREALSQFTSLNSDVKSYLNSNDQYDQQYLLRVLETYESIGEEILGFNFNSSTDSTEGDSVAEDLVEYREELRDKDEYEKADEIRDALEQAGYRIEDSEDGPVIIET